MFYSFANKYLCLLLFVYYFVYLFMAFLPLHPRALGIAIIMHWEFIKCLCLNCDEKGESKSFRASKPNVKSRLQRKIKAKVGTNNWEKLIGKRHRQSSTYRHQTTRSRQQSPTATPRQSTVSACQPTTNNRNIGWKAGPQPNNPPSNRSKEL
jgi:hypothetical protein